MKKSFIYSMAALLVAGAAFTACSSSENDIENGQPEQPVAKTYALNVQAEKEGYVTPAGTRAQFQFDDKKLTVNWTSGDHVSVFYYDDSSYTQELGDGLYAQDTSDLSLLTGRVSGMFSKGQMLNMKFNNNPDYDEQLGTKEGLTNVYQAKATVEITGVNNKAATISTTRARFVSQQAIVRFTLNQSVTSFKVEVDDHSTYYANYIVKRNGSTTISSTNEIWMAIPGFEKKEVKITANSSSGTLIKTVPNITMNNGEFWDIQVNF